jgi:hypothetical protein
MGLNRLFSVSPAVKYVAPRYVSMMCSLLVSSGLMMLGRFPVMACSMRQMFRCFLVMLNFDAKKYVGIAASYSKGRDEDTALPTQMWTVGLSAKY